MYQELTTPAVVVDLDTVERNIQRMAKRLQSSSIQHRPHMKTHKTVFFGRQQLAAGAVGITVAKLSEAEVFVKAGFTDILIAYSIVGTDKLERLEALHRQAKITTVVDSLTVAEGLSSVGVADGKPIRVLIEVDGGLHRGGRQPGQDTVDFARSIRDLPGIQVVGIMEYNGRIYDEGTDAELIAAVTRESELLQETVRQLEEVGIECEVISAGSTPASTVSQHLKGVTESRAGNYIFYDVSAVDMGLAREEDCALRVIATVVSTPLPGRATIDAGTKTLTSDHAHHRDGHGIVVGHPEVKITGLNEEHGFLQFDPMVIQFAVGDRIEIIPNHACVIPNLNDYINGVRDGRLVERIRVDARGCNY